MQNDNLQMTVIVKEVRGDDLSTKIESPEVMLDSFVSASSSRLDPC
jgi:hypothetical protein